MGRLFDLARSEADKKIANLWWNYTPTWYQKEFHDCKDPFRTLIVGRRGGKSHALIHDILMKCVTVGGSYQIIAPIWNQCYITVRKYKEIIRPHKDLIRREWVTQGSPPYRVEFENGAEITWASGDNPDSIAGQGPNGYGLDEFALYPHQEELWDIILPATMDYGASITIITTPRGVGNLTYRLWWRGKHPDQWPGYRSWGYLAGEPDLYGVVIPFDRGIPSYENPFLKRTPEQLRKEMTSEYKYQEDVLAIFQPALDQALRVPVKVWGSGKWLEGPEPNKQYYAGIDIGKHADYTVVSVIDSDHHLVHMYRTQMDYAMLKTWIVERLRHWNALAVQDTTGLGDPVYDEMIQLYSNIMPYNIFDNNQKRALIERLQLGFDHDLIKVPDPDQHRDSIGIFAEEVKTFTMKRLANGQYQYMARERCHDDTIMSVALAWYIAYSGNLVQGVGDVWAESKDGAVW